ncbi:two-component regulator propeller domain-containing protein [Formosa sp. S-31]|uniref:type IX secretion system anionic LPS delivery protein PorZ n=1 Tax=Formosa sp. S-31 TaxID=2790949 RepID=UPI003EBC99D4
MLFTISIFSQDYSSSWSSYFSYLDIKDLVLGHEKIYAAAENSIFIYDINTQELETISTVNGLSGGIISTIYYSEVYDVLMVGYSNGLIELVLQNDETHSVVDILNKTTIPSDRKGINDFNEVDGVVYISADYGISIYNLGRLEFGDSYFIGNGNSYARVNQTTVYNNYIYAACGDSNGVKRALITNPNLINANEWQNITNGDFKAVEKLGNELYAFSNTNRIYEIENNTVYDLFGYSEDIVDVKLSNNNLIVTTTTKVEVYAEGLTVKGIISNSEYKTTFTSGIIDTLDNVYIGTQGQLNVGRPGYGVLKTSLSNPISFLEIHPDGPLLNKIFSLKTPPNEIWAVFGGYSASYNFNGGVGRSGISHFKGGNWKNIYYDSIAKEIKNPLYLSKITVNPLKTSQVFVSSYYSGLIEFNSDKITALYNKENSSLVPFTGNLYLTLQGAYDTNGALWVMNGRVDSPLNKFENGKWNSYSFKPVIADPLTDELGFSDILIDAQGTKFIGSGKNGLIGYNNSTVKKIEDEEHNLPSNNVTALTLDNRNQLWIGTGRGLRVLYNTSSFFTDSNVQVNEIVVLDDGIPKELLAQQYITDIEVDGSNNKWVGTIGSGVFYFSSDGQETIFHFTTDNSPLPSNDILDISIDSSNGKVYIATEGGLVAFKSGSSKTTDDFTDAFVYPNPVRPGFNITEDKVKIKGVTDNVNIKITDVEGNLVAEAQSNINLRYNGYNLEIDGGTAYWNGKNLANNIVRSGVYLIMLSDLDTFETKVLKVMVVR